MTLRLILFNTLGWFFGLLFSAIGILNMFWGNDPQFGVFLFILSGIFYPPLNVLFTKITHRTIPIIVKIIIALFILWVSLGVGELFAKISLMRESFVVDMTHPAKDLPAAGYFILPVVNL